MIKKRILKELDKAVERYREESLDLSSNKLTNLITGTANRLKNERTFELERVRMQLTNELLEMTEKGDKEAADEANLKKRIIDEAINIRRANQRRYNIERNYAEAPLFAVSSPKSLTKLQNAEGHIIERREGYRKITFIARHGKYLTSVDSNVFYGLQQLWASKGEKQTFEFTLKELCDVLNLTYDGGNIQMLTASINKLFHTYVILDDYKDETTRYKTEEHNLIQSVEYYFKDKRKKESIEKISITLNQYLHEGLKRRNVVKINLTAIQDFNYPTSKILYPLFASAIRDTREFKLDKLIHTAGLHYIDRKEALKKIKRALDEFKETGLILSYELLHGSKKSRYDFVYVEPSNLLLEEAPPAQQLSLPLFD